jgi:hypothetical protein
VILCISPYFLIYTNPIWHISIGEYKYECLYQILIEFIIFSQITLKQCCLENNSEKRIWWEKRPSFPTQNFKILMKIFLSPKRKMFVFYFYFLIFLLKILPPNSNNICSILYGWAGLEILTTKETCIISI